MSEEIKAAFWLCLLSEKPDLYNAKPKERLKLIKSSKNKKSKRKGGTACWYHRNRHQLCPAYCTKHELHK